MGFTVKSHADGSMRVFPHWKPAYTKPGVFTRMALAEAIERRLNGKRKLK